MSRAAQLARLERERLLTLERRGKARLEAQAVAGGVAESVALSRARGAAIVMPPAEPGERQRTYRRLPGLEWLARRGRLSEAQKWRESATAPPIGGPAGPAPSARPWTSSRAWALAKARPWPAWWPRPRPP